MKNHRVSPSELRNMLSYDPRSGLFERKCSAGPQKSGPVNNVPSFSGYLYISVSGQKILLHRAAWCLSYGEWPSTEIDHIDGNKQNNALSNLRLATRAQNEANKKRYEYSKRDIKGVRWDIVRGKWFSYITVGGVMKNLGRYDCFAKALRVRTNAAKERDGSYFRAA